MEVKNDRLQVSRPYRRRPQKIYKWMDLGRKTDERLWLLNRAGKIPFVVSGQGQEATQIGMAYAMQKVISHRLIIVI